MNIIEAYIKFEGQLIIFISGLPACGKLKLAKYIQRDFKIKLINQFDYYKKDYDVKTSLPDGTPLINWYTDDAIDWDKFNSDIEKFGKNEGVVVVGFSLPDNKITAKPDYHIHLNVSKQVCMEKRKKFVEKNKNKYPEEFKIIGTPTEKLKMNKLIYPYYMESTKNSKINKFLNITNMNDSQVYDAAFDILINFIEDYLYPEVTEDTPKVSRIRESDNTAKQTDQSGITISGELLDKPKYTYQQENAEDMDMVSKYSDPDEYDEGDGDDGPISFVDMTD